MTTGPVTVEEVRRRLGGAPMALEGDLEAALAVAVAHVTPLLRTAYRDPATWPADLHDGIASAAVLTYRNFESPLAGPSEAYVEGALPMAPPITWDPRVRQRWAPYLDPGVWVG